jgi:hypothetical protein
MANRHVLRLWNVPPAYFLKLCTSAHTSHVDPRHLEITRNLFEIETLVVFHFLLVWWAEPGAQ